MYRGVIFDLDGTLLDTLEDIADAANAAVRQYGYSAHPVEAFKGFVGDGARTMITRALPSAARSERIVEVALESFLAQYERNWKAKTRPYPGITALCETLAQRKLRLAVLSNKPNDFAKRCVRTLLPCGEFSVVRGQRAGFPRKPNPAAAAAIAHDWSIPPQEIIFLGDSGVDMITATRAGMLPVGVLWGFRTADELLATGARLLVERPEEVLSLLGEE